MIARQFYISIISRDGLLDKIKGKKKEETFLTVGLLSVGRIHVSLDG